MVDLILAGDIGGTKTNLAVYSNLGLASPIASATYVSAEYETLAEILKEFCNKFDLKVKRAAFGVAGPVINGRAKITKLPWTIDPMTLQKYFGFEQVIIVNDLVATAHGLAVIGDSELVTLNSGQPAEKSPRVIIAPGTGLGETFMVWKNGAYKPYPSEGGHTPFAPVNDLQDRLFAYLRSDNQGISNDLVCSGRGIPLLYKFLHHIKYAEELDSVRRKLSANSDLSPMIVEAAMAAAPSPLCAATISLFVSILASESANFALKTMATGGVYLGGGMPPRIIPFLKKNFMDDFLGQKVLRDLLADMPVRVIMEPKTALLGAASLLI